MPICSALHFFGENNTHVGSLKSSPKFSDCSSNGEGTSHFMLGSSCYFCSAKFHSFRGHPVDQKWLNLELAVVLSHSKFCRCLLSHHSSCVINLHHIPLKLDFSARIYVITIVHWLWHQCEVILLLQALEIQNTTQQVPCTDVCTMKWALLYRLLEKS